MHLLKLWAIKLIYLTEHRMALPQHGLNPSTPAGGRGSRGAATLWTPGSRACMLLPSRLCALPGCACGFRRHARGPPWRARGPRGGFQGHGAGLGAPGFLGPGARQRCPFQAACPPHHSSAQKAAGNLGQSLLAYPFFVFTYLLLFIKLTIISG